MARLRILFLLCLIGVSATTQAATSWEENRLIPLQKLTVGPWDNFEATVSPDDQTIYYTRDQNRIPNILQQDQQSGETTLLIGKTGDAKEPSLNPAGTRLAVTYYGTDAQGDICLFTLQNQALNCITSSDTLDKSPFWINDNLLGYLSRNTAQTDWDLVIHDLTTNVQEVLYHGLISAPTASPDGRYILLTRAAADGSVRLHAWDRNRGKMVTPARFDLSGITGVATVSGDSGFLYFNQYLNDTNGDQVIDGNDNSVAFRIPFNKWLQATKPLLPEQLTSVAKNCKFPSLSPNYLYLTCAFESSLDIYRLPLTGTVPPDWDQQRLWEAHRTARSHEARLLILNTLRYRFGLNSTNMLERLLSNHLEIGELTAARYYVTQLQARYRQQKDRATVSFYQTLGDLFHVRASKQQIPVGVVTARFQRIVEKTRQQIHARSLRPELTTLMDAWFDYELEHEQQALTQLQRYDLARPGLLPLERVLAFELYRKLLEATQPQQLLDIYPLMFNESSLSLESRIYYAFNYLKLLSRVEKPVAPRIKAVETQLGHVQDPKLAELFRGEIAALKLVASKDQESRNASFKALNKLLKKNRDDLLLRKALHVRAIQNLGEADQFQYMELLSRHWLVTTKTSEMEFVNVAEQFAVITMDKAYGMLAQGQAAKAYATFYSAIRQTNDLEAHYQFITLGLTPGLGKRDNLERSYEILKKQDLLGQNENYVKALRLLLEADADNPKGQAKALKAALALLQPMRTRGLNPAIRDLLMGYIHHQQLRASQSGYRYDKSLFQKAHYHYIMALDLGRDNSRVTASVWENLAWLHFEVRNYALSVDFFTRRMGLPFVTPEDEARTRLAFARALFANNQPELAQQQAAAALTLARQNMQLEEAPFLEKSAFYALQAGDYATATQAWETLLADAAALSGDNHARALLGYGYALLKRGKAAAAAAQFHALLKLCETLKPLPANATRLIPFQPKRYQLLAWGFLTELADSPQQRISYRQERTRLLQEIAGHSDDLAWKEATRLSLLAKDYQLIAVERETAGQYPQMASAMEQALLAATNWVEETDDQVGPVIYRTLINYLSLALSHPQYFAGTAEKLLETRCRQTLNEFAKQTWRPAALITRQMRLTLLWEAWQAKRSHQKTIDLTAMLNTPELQQLKIDKPEAWEGLREMADSLQNLQ